MTVLTTSSGSPVDDNQNSLTTGKNGPILLQDFHLIDKIAHFDRERIPERVVHAKGAGAHGYFEVTAETNKIRALSKAAFLSEKGKKTPVLIRFSTVGGEKGSADTERDPRGFAIKFYTEEGNWDMVGNNTPVFFIRDPLKFPDFIHTQKRNAQTNLKDPDAFWDFLSLVPESIHQVSILFSDRGTPDGYRRMNGYSSHTLKLVNAQNEVHYVKWHVKTDQGIANLTREKATELAGTDPDYATRDLFHSIATGKFPSWTVSLQVMTPEQAAKYKWNPLDVTKVWPHGDFPLVPIGKIVLNKNPENYFAEIEQVAFSPGHLVPGIETSNDKMLQGRLFSYPDTHRHRLGTNYTQIPVNCPMRAKVRNYQRDGFMAVNGNGGSGPNYEPNSHEDAPKQLGNQVGISYTPARPVDELQGTMTRAIMPLSDLDFAQAGALYRIQSADGRTRWVGNVVAHMKNAKPHIRNRQLAHWKRADAELGRRIEEGIVKAVGSRL